MPTIQLVGERSPAFASILTDDALAFVAKLETAFGERRRALLAARSARQARLLAGEMPDFLPETAAIRAGDWRVAPTPEPLQRRWVEITGPTDAKMVINALNSGANVFMADFEDANSPSWANMIGGQANLYDAIRRTLTLESGGKTYALNDETALLMVRPRGWHLEEAHVLVDGRAVSASLFDFGLYCYHNAGALIERGVAPYFYLPKMESHHEAALWADAFTLAEDLMGLAHGTIKVTVLIETILAAFEMDEILYALRDYIVGLNAGRWDYIFSIIKKFHKRADVLLPDRAQITMTVPFMRAYTELLVQTCHKRGAHAMGGMAAHIPRRDPAANETAFAQVKRDKAREANDGFDGTWVAHPGLIELARAEFAAVLGDQPHQKHRLREDVRVSAADLLQFNIPNAAITEAGLRNNLNVSILYVESWLRGVGAAALYNLMEDTATAEISRAQVWQWLNHPDAVLSDGREIDERLVRALLEEEYTRIRADVGEDGFQQGRFAAAKAIIERLVFAPVFDDFLTLVAMPELESSA